MGRSSVPGIPCAMRRAILKPSAAAGTGIAIEAADVVLTGGRLSAIMDRLEIGSRAYVKTVQKLWLAFIFNGIGVPAGTPIPLARFYMVAAD